MRIVLLLVLCGFSVHCWSCGEGKFTEGLAWIIAAPADRQSINKCCVTHDQNYQNFCNGIGSISLETADFLFQRCLENTNNRWVRFVVKPLYTAAVGINSWWKKIIKNPC
ncbi:hypothetical protein GCK72_023709 [Caenorhabditis remanei]|uniref:Uncharacterized protein n=1 Tax=Caenorhabditis remanei TaxID=31234 RepID=A0A6A5FXJ6_CAERE|nr:hypothetical protein GCK72_023709 [Caenorhabditis remanei]KAF1747247.1 hypothetical protein GCK72_023709 [Caenorhabditis remanei]